MKVRDATPDDAPAVAAIKVAGWRAAYHGLVPDAALAALDVGQLTGQWRTVIASLVVPSGCLVAERDGVVAGYVAFGAYRWPELSGAGEVYALYVDPAAWAQGLGRALMKAAQQRLEAAGLSEQALWVLETNQPGRRFYEALGWSWDGASDARCEVEGALEVRYRRTA